MKLPILRDLLRSDSINISSNMRFSDLSPLSTYLGKPGNPDKGGLSFEEYKRRQAQHRDAEIKSMRDVPRFIDKAKTIYGYDHFICDAGGSLCEVVDPADPNDAVLNALGETTVIVHLRGTEAMRRCWWSGSPRPQNPCTMRRISSTKNGLNTNQ